MGSKKEGSDRPARCEDHDLSRILKEMGVEVPSIVQNVRGKDMLSPLYLARIAERVQFDGDLPELRFGPLPMGANPAVPVRADVFSSKALGVLLDRASEEVKEDLYEAQGILNEQFKAEHSLVHAEDMSNVPQVPGASVPGYAPASAPALREMTCRPEDLQASTKRTVWSVLGTTQGRKSVADILERRLGENYTIAEEDLSEPDETYRWEIGLHEVADSNPNFNVIGLVQRVFLRYLEGANESVQFRIVPINRVHERKVGWECQLWMMNPDASGH